MFWYDLNIILGLGQIMFYKCVESFFKDCKTLHRFNDQSLT